MPCLFMQGPTAFHLPADRKEEALALLQTYYESAIRGTHRDDEDPEPFASLEEGLLTMGWEATCNGERDITLLTYTDKYYTNEGNALDAIACCVTADSSLIVVLEHEGQLGFGVEEWLFDGRRMHIVEAALSFTSLPARNPDQKSTPQLLVGIQQGLSLGLLYFLALLRRDPDLARSLEELYLLERHIQREDDRGKQAVSTLGLLVATITHLIERADSGD